MIGQDLGTCDFSEGTSLATYWIDFIANVNNTDTLFLFIKMFLAQIKNSIAERTQNITSRAIIVQPEWASKNNAHLRPILPSND